MKTKIKKIGWSLYRGRKPMTWFCNLYFMNHYIFKITRTRILQSEPFKYNLIWHHDSYQYGSFSTLKKAKNKTQELLQQFVDSIIDWK